MANTDEKGSSGHNTLAYFREILCSTSLSLVRWKTDECPHHAQRDCWAHCTDPTASLNPFFCRYDLLIGRDCHQRLTHTSLFSEAGNADGTSVPTFASSCWKGLWHWLLQAPRSQLLLPSGLSTWYPGLAEWVSSRGYSEIQNPGSLLDPVTQNLCCDNILGIHMHRRFKSKKNSPTLLCLFTFSAQRRGL